ncbi:9933_t:CDS:2 [Scutellospora calospora]|uniref:9933_t:CDS:1 n=1 Tax=Scutellospora calospora TaxID=85575 RepID=A0ACA9K7C2_9GLOM|nr:9933_t:CDS:2 [Scutellospora calospora]
MNKEIIKEYAIYVLAVQKYCQYSLTEHDINNIHLLFQSFYLHYKRFYDQFNKK